MFLSAAKSAQEIRSRRQLSGHIESGRNRLLHYAPQLCVRPAGMATLATLHYTLIT